MNSLCMLVELQTKVIQMFVMSVMLPVENLFEHVCLSQMNLIV